MAIIINYERHRGDTYGDEISIISETDGTPVDITGFTFLMTVDTRKSPDDASTVVYQLSGNILSGVGGTVEFVPSEAQSDQLPTTYFYDIQMQDLTGRIRTIQKGKYKYVQDITKN